MKGNSEDIFQRTKVKNATLKKYLMKEGRGLECEECGISEYNGKPITLQLHHIDGNPKNNSRENLKFLCPNCHSQTTGWCCSPAKSDVSDEDLLKALKESSTVKEALSKVSLRPSAGNYFRVQKLLQKI